MKPLKALSPIRLENGKNANEHKTAEIGDFFLANEEDAAMYKRLGVASELSAEDLIRFPDAARQIAAAAEAAEKAARKAT